jgi:imidazole glycerol-phosphate synthase subunit HisH
MQKVAIIKYNAGNIFSVINALERLNVQYVLTDDEKTIRSADKVIFPGVGEASSAMAYLQSKGLDAIIKSLTQPVLGICLGMQIMCTHSEENDTDCLNIFNMKIRKFKNMNDSKIKIPHMGWNEITGLKSPLFKSVNESSYVYFVHSYYAVADDPDSYRDAIATCNYIQDFSAALQKDNFYGVQFHPEKSSDIGETIIQNFLDL